MKQVLDEATSSCTPSPHDPARSVRAPALSQPMRSMYIHPEPTHGGERGERGSGEGERGGGGERERGRDGGEGREGEREGERRGERRREEKRRGERGTEGARGGDPANS